MVAEAMSILGIARPDDEVGEFSSPACSMHEVSDAYMGYADKVEPHHASR